MRYLWDSVDRGLFLPASSDLALTAYSDADLGGYLNTRCSTSGYCVFLGASLVSWSSKWQATPSRSSVDAEYRAVANAIVKTT